jgi:putative ABC transport system substrate-binding protein
MRRREFITLLGGAATAWPLGARAQQPARPVIGLVSSSNSSASGAFMPLITAFRQGLNEGGGYVEGQNLTIEYRWAGGQYGRMPELLNDLIRRQVNLIVASGGLVAAKAATAATKTIPILFVAGFDPVEVGLVPSLSRPGGNATGVTVHTTELLQKRVELLHRVVPGAGTIALLLNPNSTVPTVEIKRLEEATRELNLKLLTLEASVDSDFEKAFASAVRQGVGALSISGDAFFTTRRNEIVALAASHKLPTAYPWREYVEAGGLMSYGPTLTWAYNQLGHYASRILKGERPSDLPVQQPKTFQLVLNLKTARALGLTIPRIVAASAEIVE